MPPDKNGNSNQILYSRCKKIYDPKIGSSWDNSIAKNRHWRQPVIFGKPGIWTWVFYRKVILRRCNLDFRNSKLIAKMNFCDYFVMNHCRAKHKQHACKNKHNPEAKSFLPFYSHTEGFLFKIRKLMIRYFGWEKNFQSTLKSLFNYGLVLIFDELYKYSHKLL